VALLIGFTKSAILSWFGIAGGALTAFSNLQGVLDLAAWANWLCAAWARAIYFLWTPVSTMLGIRLDSGSTLMISMAVFVSVMAVSSRFNRPKTDSNSLSFIQRVFNAHVLIAIVLYCSYVFAVIFALRNEHLIEIFIENQSIILILGHLIYMTSIVIGLKNWPFSSAFFVAISMVALSYIFLSGRPSLEQIPTVSESVSSLVALVFSVLCGLVVVGVADPSRFAKRLIFLWTGLSMLIALNYLSDLGMDISAPATS
jgi:hypothetical protein